MEDCKGVVAARFESVGRATRKVADQQKKIRKMQVFAVRMLFPLGRTSNKRSEACLQTEKRLGNSAARGDCRPQSGIKRLPMRWHAPDARGGGLLAHGWEVYMRIMRRRPEQECST
jgi:hypothetical protein